MNTKILRVAALGLGVSVLAAGLFFMQGDKAVAADTAATTPVTTPTKQPTDQIALGRYLTKAADCAACHTAKDGAPFAGGVKLASPFGNFYGSNITPDKDHGIGKWSADEFYKALHDGVAPDKHLYPSMPYTSYRGMTRADSDAIFAYLKSIPPAAVENQKNELKFPYNLRFGMVFWNMLFLKDKLPDASVGQSAQWLRGQYLVNSLGHCAECHSPRSALGQMDFSKPLSGGELGRVIPPNITPAGLAAVGWTATDLQTFFTTGIAPQGSAYGEMFPVVHLSSQHLTKEDVIAVTTYLMGDKPLPAQPMKNISEIKVDATELKAGQKLYIAVCAGCHGAEGKGKPNVTVAMDGNSTVRNSNPHNLIVAMLDGIEAQKFPGFGSMQDMPGFAGKLDDKQLAQLSNYLRASWGGQAADVTPDNVKALRDGAAAH
ncbi:c-type cytochrome [Glaciimonas soli]|uniref:C-type cytochrome n=1 Tax=Glaciimonas soli TaxID=2590999 RepID=A0A843YWB2_9BURK|nr:c-type cytochrome [Glaciimonas soli]MQR01788.1 c-type cytochrome [Glaciimonas soli]